METNFNFELWEKNQEELHPEKTGRFLMTSLILHGLFILIAFAASLQMFEDKKNEPVEIEILNSPTAFVSAKAEKITDSSSAPAVKATSSPARETVAAAAPEKAENSDVIVPSKAAIVRPAPVKTVAAKVTPITAPAARPVKATAKMSTPVQAYQGESPAIIPESINDIQEPQLANATAAAANPNDINDDEDLKKDFAKVDHHQKKQVMALAQDLENQNKEALSETEKAADEAAKENQLDGEKIASFNAAQRARDAQAIAAAESAERAAAATATQQAKEARAAALASKNAQDAKEAAAVAAASDAHEKALGQAIADANAKAAKEQALKEAAGNGSGSSAAMSGIPTGVRDAQDLRQRPGNPLPQYEQKERLLGHQGKVVFLAYVTPEGVPTQFKLSDSTGHKNLDVKTLTALKQWRFYPGQEGWVEMAFNWSLKGGAQEMPALLKRSAR